METSRAQGGNGSRDTIIYVAKCLAGTVISYSLYVAFPRYPLYWSIISVLLVLDPDEKESMRLSYARMKANIAGAAVGVVAILAFGRVRLVALCVAVVATLALCQLIKLGKATRSALAALVIVTVSGPATWITGLERMACVVFGCLVAMALNIVVSLATGLMRPRRDGREA